MGLEYSIDGNGFCRFWFNDDDKDFCTKKSQRIWFGLSSA